MSIESAKAFMERMQTDKDFAKKIIACKDWENARPLLSGEGYHFTIEEFKSVAGLDIDDEALDKVAGGFYMSQCYPENWP
jgi:predicted ribosomally synthesized peptide with nif11-like leader